MESMVFDKDGALDRVDNDRELLVEIFQILEEQIAQTFVDLRAHIASNDSASFRSTAHSLKGASANVGANMLAEIMKSLEVRGQKSEIADAETDIARAQEAAKLFVTEFKKEMGL